MLPAPWSRLRIADVKAGISPIPVYYDAGTFVVDKSNVDLLLGGAAARG